MTFERAKIVHAARHGIPLVIKSHCLPPRTEQDLEEILGVFLEELGQTALHDRLSYCLRELTGNAKKANTKRVYFRHRGLDLNNPADYEAGMKTFKTDTLDDIGTFLTLQEEQDLSIKVGFLIRDQVLFLTVRNNTPILDAELDRARARAERSWGFESMDDAFTDLLDDAEGAGLGIGILVMMLRKMGLDRRSYRLERLGNETLATLILPMEAVRQTRLNQVADKVVAVLDSLPPFPENLQTLLRLLEDPQVAFGRLAEELGRDPAMTADLIKYINSARNRGYSRIESLQEAIRIVGLRGLQELLYPYGAHRVLDKYLGRQRELWDNAIRVSLLATELCRERNLAWGSLGQAQIAGLLYNLGQIIQTFVNPELSAKIQRFCRDKGFSIQTFDELTQAVNPADLGARVAEKWKFPADLVQILRCQTRPSEAPEELRAVTAAVHLAASLRWVELGLMTYDQIASEPQLEVGWGDPGTLQEFHERVTG